MGVWGGRMGERGGRGGRSSSGGGGSGGDERGEWRRRGVKQGRGG